MTSQPVPLVARGRKELEDELEVWQMWVAGHHEHDPGIAAGPIPRHPMPPALERVPGRRRRQPPPEARTAIPEWRLDPNRSFVSRIPVDIVRWTFAGSFSVGTQHAEE